MPPRKQKPVPSLTQPAPTTLPSPPRAKLAVAADLHIANHSAHGGPLVDGLNARGRLCVETFRLALRTAREAGTTHFLVAGDFFHSWKPEPPLVAAVQRAIVDEATGMRLIFVPGNHDMRDASPAQASTSMEPLASVGVEIVRAPTWYHLNGQSVLCVPFTSEMPMSEYLAQSIKSPAVVADQVELALQDSATSPVLVTHVGVYDDGTHAWLRGKRDSISSAVLIDLMIDHGIKVAFVGNYHQHQIWESPSKATILQIGTLMPASYSDNGVYPAVGGMWTSTGLNEVSGPRFIIDPSDYGYPVFNISGSTNTYFVRGEATSLREAGLTVGGVDLLVEDGPALVIPEEKGGAIEPPEDPLQAIDEWAKARGVSEESLEVARGYWAKAGEA